MHARPDDSRWPGQRDLVPPELLHTREWIHEMFQQAARGLPWPHQMSLMLIEQAIMLGMFGGLLASAWSLTQRTGQLPDPGNFDLAGFLGQLEGSTRDALPEHVQVAIRHVQSYLDQGPQQAIERTVGQLWDQVWGGEGPRPPFPPSMGK